MKIKIPFTGKHLYIGRKAVEGAKQRILYGFYQNANFLSVSSRIDFKALYKLYNRLVDVRQCVKKIQNATAKGGYRIVDKADPEKDGNTKETEIANGFLNHPDLPFNKWKDQWIHNRFVAGNFYMQIQNSSEIDKSGVKIDAAPIRPSVIDPRTMVIVSDKYGNILKYIQRVQGYEEITFDPDEIVHSVIDVSTRNPLLGSSPMESIVIEGQTELEAQKSNLVFYENNAVPSHLLIVDEQLTKEQHEELKKNVDSKFKGTENRFKSGIIPYVKDIKTITPSHKDMQYLESRWFTTKKIVVAFGVDSFILGYTEKVQRGNADVIYKMFYENTIRPQEIALEEMINQDLFPKLGLHNIEIRINQSSYDNKKEIAEITRLDSLYGIITPNEAREARGLKPSDNPLADDLLFSGMPLEDLDEEISAAIDSIQKHHEAKRKALYSNLLD